MQGPGDMTDGSKPEHKGGCGAALAALAGIGLVGVRVVDHPSLWKGLGHAIPEATHAAPEAATFARGLTVSDHVGSDAAGWRAAPHSASDDALASAPVPHSGTTRTLAPIDDAGQPSSVRKVRNQAVPKIVTDLQPFGNHLTKDEAAAILRRELAAAATITARQNPRVEFEVLTGKLKVAAAYDMKRARVSVGEVNLYRVAALGAAGVVACRELQARGFQACVGRAVAKAIDAAGKEAAAAGANQPSPSLRAVRPRHPASLPLR